MKLKTLQIVWHERKPIFTTEFLTSDILATGGADQIIRVRKLAVIPLSLFLDLERDPTVELESELTGMKGSINCIRVAPDGGRFAAGGDKGEVMIWKRNTDPEYSRPWRPACTLRGHTDDIFDISWSSDGSCLATASLEGVTIVWDTLREKSKVHLSEHHHYVQGIAWDPFNQFLVSQGGDRRCKVYSLPTPDSIQSASRTASNWKVSRTLFKIKNQPDGIKNFMFHDDTLTSFFRRLDWSPDGAFLVIPAGIWKPNEDSIPTHVAFVYSRGNWSSPIACLPAPAEPFIIVRFCPVFFKKTVERIESPVFELPYDLVFACATLHSLLIYRTNELAPIALVSGLHYSEITDLAWSPDGQFLMVSSTDGYCSVVQFEDGDLGLKFDDPLLIQEQDCQDWFKALEEVKKAQDPILLKKRLTPQKLTQEGSKMDASVTQKRQKRRIVPTAISADEMKQDLINKSTGMDVERGPRVETLNSTLSRELCSDLQQFMDPSNPVLNRPVLDGPVEASGRASEAATKSQSFSEFLTSTQNYANRRFQ